MSKTETRSDGQSTIIAETILNNMLAEFVLSVSLWVFRYNYASSFKFSAFICIYVHVTSFLWKLVKMARVLATG